MALLEFHPHHVCFPGNATEEGKMSDDFAVVRSIIEVDLPGPGMNKLNFCTRKHVIHKWQLIINYSYTSIYLH